MNNETRNRTIRVLTLAVMLCALCLGHATAQSRFGFYSNEAALRSMPAYSVMQAQVGKLRAQYDDELRRAEEEFNNKYEAFLDVQRELAPTILNKRQTELQELMERNLKFKQEARQQVQQFEQQQTALLQNRIDEAVQQLGSERSLMFVLNTDGHSLPYADPALADDLNDELQQLLSK